MENYAEARRYLSEALTAMERAKESEAGPRRTVLDH
jgi:hypothetical protein